MIPAGQVIDEIGWHLELLPTIGKAADAGIPADRTMDGHDTLPLAATRGKSPHDAIFWSNAGQLAVRRGKWKLVKNGKTFDGTLNGDKSLTGDDTLFLSDLDNDPGESKNLRHQFPRVVDDLETAERRLAGVGIELRGNQTPAG